MRGRSGQAGFTFIELMSVVAIIGILASIVLPNIKNYTARAKVSEAVLALTNCRNQVSEIYLAGAQLPLAGNWGCESGATSKYVDSIRTTDDGVVIVTTSAAMGDLRVAIKDISMTPINRAGQAMSDVDQGTGVFRWRCGSTIDGTNLDQSFLPSSCRGI